MSRMSRIAAMCGGAGAAIRRSGAAMTRRAVTTLRATGRRGVSSAGTRPCRPRRAPAGAAWPTIWPRRTGRRPGPGRGRREPRLGPSHGRGGAPPAGAQSALPNGCRLRPSRSSWRASATRISVRSLHAWLSAAPAQDHIVVRSSQRQRLYEAAGRNVALIGEGGTHPLGVQEPPPETLITVRNFSGASCPVDCWAAPPPSDWGRPWGNPWEASKSAYPGSYAIHSTTRRRGWATTSIRAADDDAHLFHQLTSRRSPAWPCRAGGAGGLVLGRAAALLRQQVVQHQHLTSVTRRKCWSLVRTRGASGDGGGQLDGVAEPVAGPARAARSATPRKAPATDVRYLRSALNIPSADSRRSCLKGSARASVMVRVT